MNLRDGVLSVGTLALALAVLVGCSGGDVNISADNNSSVTDNSTTTTTSGGSSNPCASYTDPDGGADVEGTFDGQNCVYDSNFVGINNPLMVDLSIPFISGVHIFEDTLAVGADTDGTTPPPGKGEGPSLTVAAGNTLAWTNAGDYLLVTRGSQIFANGSPTAPITFTGFTDAVTGTAGAEDVQLWGGVVINGRGMTNKCSDDQRANNECNVLAEGKPSHYGGNDNADSSGALRYVVVKHTGFEAAPGDELNGVSFNAVGSDTVVEYLQAYSTFDDGIEFFGGAVEVSNYVALYVRDDSIDYDQGWTGGIDRALVIHSASDGNRCIEGDSLSAEDAGMPVTNVYVNNLTCINSGSDEVPSGTGTHGDSEGIVNREGARTQLRNSIIFDGYARTVLSSSGNECFELDDGNTRDAAQAGEASVSGTVIACEEATKDSLGNGDSIGEWITNSTRYANNTGNVIVTESDSANLSLLGGRQPFYTAGELTDATGAPLGVELADTDGDGDTGDETLGAVAADDDWTANWTVGLDSLWFD